MTDAGRWTRARERRVAAPVTLAAVAALASQAACGNGGGETCDCADRAIVISVPADIASSVTSVSLSGAACSSSKATLTNETNGSAVYSFDPDAAGTCTIDVAFADTTFTDTLTIVDQTGCCAGFYASPPVSAQVDVPEPGDAG